MRQQRMPFGIFQTQAPFDNYIFHFIISSTFLVVITALERVVLSNKSVQFAKEAEL